MNRRTKLAKPVGLLIRDARRLAGITQRAAAVLVGVSRQSWCMWERGRRIPHRRRMVGIVKTLKHVARLPGIHTRAKFYNKQDDAGRQAHFLEIRRMIRKCPLETVRELLKQFPIK